MTGELFNGQRMFDLKDPHNLKPGEYGECDGIWYARTPSGHMGNLGGHEVKEHAGGTITVSPSIEVSTSENGVPVVVYHGYLEHGIWRTA